MAKREITQESWDLTYSASDDDHNDIKRLSISFENPEDDGEVIAQLNTFLQAVGKVDIVVKEFARG